MIISAPRLFLEGAFTGPGAIAVEGGVITRVLAGETQGDVRLSHGFLAPGLIDLHNNGAFGVDCAVASPGEWDVYIARLAAKGVTSVLPTIITAPLGDLRVSAAGVAGAMARHGAILGMHLEGPFLSAAKRGAHRGHWLRPPDDAAIRELMADPAMRQVLRVITLAPELPGALGAIERLVAAGVVVSLGHTEANAAQMLAALSAGASMVTHVFNAQSPLHHRVPGAPGVALTDDRVFPCLITDGVHVDPMILKLAFAASPRAIAVTDSIVIAGMPAGAVKEFGGAPVVMGANGVGQRAGGTIVGAGITLDEGVRRLIAAGVPPEVAFAAATSRPAAALGLTDRGRIEAGLRADLVWWSDDFAVQQVWAAGTAGPAAPPRKPAPRGTEYAHGDAANLDERESLDIVTAFLKQEEVAQRALAAAAPSLASLADAVAARLQAGGRLFYVGAGTSGRLAMLDAMECGPTFGLAEGVIIPILAGGKDAFSKPAEGAEDDLAAAVSVLQGYNITRADALIGIAASGTTPFTLAAVLYARGMGALSGAIVNNAGSGLAQAAEFSVQIDSGAEIIAGSTRLSAGTAQKIALNILSSTVMIRLGKVYGPYMVDMRATNTKLRSRAIRMTAEIAQVDEERARMALEDCHMHVKTAVVMLTHGLSVPEATRRLEDAKGSLRRALNRQD